jgi:hypothetical protein
MQSPFENQLIEQIEIAARNGYQEKGRGALFVIDYADDRPQEMFYIPAADIQLREVGELDDPYLDQQLLVYDPTTQYIMVVIEPDEQLSPAGTRADANLETHLVQYRNRVPFPRTA